jgi:diamine N-acetyltransferase
MSTIEKLEIREIKTEDTIRASAPIIQNAFMTVAEQFNLTRENCPSNPAFVTIEQLQDLHKKGIKFFGLFSGEKQVGFIALEKASDDIYYIEKLSVPPDCRHKGYGAGLVRFALHVARGSGGTKVSLGMIDEHTVLKDWYKKLGFHEAGKQKFEHLPFTVCFMDKEASFIS